jgi:hypothetical protein
MMDFFKFGLKNKKNKYRELDEKSRSKEEERIRRQLEKEMKK